MEQVASLIISRLSSRLFDHIVEYATEEKRLYMGGVVIESTMMLGDVKHGSYKKWDWKDSVCYMNTKEEYNLGKLHGMCFYWKNRRLLKTLEYCKGMRHGKTHIFGKTLKELTFNLGILVELKDYDESGLIAHKRKFPGQPYLMTLHSIYNSKLQIKHTYDTSTDTYCLTKYDSNGDIDIIWSIKNGLLHGDFYAFHGNGKIKRKSQYILGIQYGPSVEFNLDESLALLSNYRMGKLHGEYRRFDGSIEVETAFYIKGILHGPYRKLEHRTELVYNYNMGKLHGLCVVYDSGSIVKQFNMNNGILQGPCMVTKCCYTMNDNYQDGLLHGESIIIRGNNMYIIQFRDGVMHGDYRLYRDTELICYAKYNLGVRISINKVDPSEGNLEVHPNCINCNFSSESRIS